MSWVTIEDFDNYSVNEVGEVINKTTTRKMCLLTNQQGIVMVGLNKDGKQYRRSVALLVAKAFVPKEKNHFISPLHLDGDRSNLNASNLIWRPRWFATEYHAQFRRPRPRLNVGIREETTKKWFKNSFEAAAYFVVLEKDVAYAAVHHTPVHHTPVHNVSENLYFTIRRENRY